MFVFRKIWHALFSCYLRFEIRLFALSPTKFDLMNHDCETFQKGASLTLLTLFQNSHSLCEKFPNMEFFLSIFSRIRTDHGKIQTRKNSVFGHFSRSDCSIRIMNKVEKDLLDINYLSV